MHPPNLPVPLRLAALLACCWTAPGVVAAQSSDSVPAPRSGCYRFEFGAWEPTLEAAKRDLARYGADWRVPFPRESGTMWDAEGDSVALLFPAWWPIGVAVRFDPEARGDTVRGEAIAYVPDGRALAPRTTIRAVRGRCGDPAPS